MKFTMRNKLLADFSHTSLTDIVLLLLIFFLLSSSFMVQTGIKVQVPNAETEETPQENAVMVTLLKTGELYVNSRQVSLETLGRSIAGALQQGPDRVVVIQADRDVSLQNTVQVLDIARASGASRFLIATEPSLERERRK